MIYDEFNKKVFGIIKGLIFGGRELIFDVVSNGLMEDERPKFFEIFCSFNSLLITEESVSEYILKIIGDYSDSEFKISEMTPAEIQEYIRNHKCNLV